MRTNVHDCSPAARWAALFLALAILLCGSARAAASSFSDLAGHWAGTDIQRLVQRGAIAGYPDGMFRPDGTVTAAEYVTLVARARSLTPAAGQTAHWAAGYLQAALAAGWYDYDEIPPTGERFDRAIPRQLAVKILMKALLPDARGDYTVWTPRIADWSAVPGRYYDAVLAAYASGIVVGENGRFYPARGLTRAEAAALLCRALDAVGDTEQLETPSITRTGGVQRNGALQVRGTQLCNAAGEPIVLRGMSSHGMQWYSQFTTRAYLKALADRGANLFRVAMYTNEDGYLQHPDEMYQKTVAAVDAAISQDLYVIVDWHILSDGDPLAHVRESKAFFQKIAARYADNPAVLYEICNEPNGNISWQGNVKPYAEAVIPVIRAQSPHSIILVGSPTWSQDVDKVAQSPLSYPNLLYTLHFYAGTHTQWLRDRTAAAVKAGLPIFVSEWGASDASGSGGPYQEETARWLQFMQARRISWANWSFCDKNEASAALRSGADPSDGLQDSELTASGRLVFAGFRDA